MKWSIFFAPIILLGFMAATTADLSVAEQTVTSFYNNLKILSAGEIDDASFEAGESCNSMVASSDVGLYFPNEFKTFGLPGSHDESNLICKSYVAQFKKMASSQKKEFSRRMQFSYRIVATVPFYEAEWKKTDNQASFIYCVVEKKYGSNFFNGIIRDTVLVNNNKKIIGIRNFAGGEAFTGHYDDHTATSSSVPVHPFSDLDITRLEVEAAKYFTNKQYVKAFTTYQTILAKKPDNANAYYRLALMSYRRQGCKQYSKKETDTMAMEYINKASLYGDRDLRKKIHNIKYYW